MYNSILGMGVFVPKLGEAMGFNKKHVQEDVSLILDDCARVGRPMGPEYDVKQVQKRPKGAGVGRGRYSWHLGGKVLQGIKEGEENGYVYFIQSEATKRIKIGHTSSLKYRLRELKTGCSDNLYYIGTLFFSTITKAREVEKCLHLIFKDYRLHGEWFEPDQNLVTFIKKHIKDTEELAKEIKARLREIQEKELEDSLPKLYPDEESKLLGRKLLTASFWVPKEL